MIDIYWVKLKYFKKNKNARHILQKTRLFRGYNEKIITVK